MSSRERTAFHESIIARLGELKDCVWSGFCRDRADDGGPFTRPSAPRLHFNFPKKSVSSHVFRVAERLLEYLQCNVALIRKGAPTHK